MNKTLIIIGREFSTRVRKKSFLVVTLIVPILMALFYAFLLWIILKDDTQERKIAVVNRSAIESPFQQINNTTFDYTGTDITEESAPEFLNANNYYAVIWLNADVMENPEVPVYSFSQVPMDLKNEIALQLQEKIESIKRDSVIARTQIPDLEEKLAATHTPVHVRTLKISEETGVAKESSSEIASILGLAAGMVIYFFIFMYASQVMKIEEKTNRIIEVLVSSVKPFQFLLGKIIGVAAVGVVQFLIWVAFGAILIIGMQAAFLPEIDMEALRAAGDMGILTGTSQLNAEQLPGSLPLLLHRRLPPVCLSLCSHWRSRGQRDRLPTIPHPAFHRPCRGTIHRLHCHEKPRILLGILEFADSLHLPHRHAGATAFRRARLGTYSIHGAFGRFLYLLHLALRADLPDRHTHVWQESHLERTLQMAEILSNDK